MMQTPYSQDNQDFSDRAHVAAQSQVYQYALDADASSLAFRCTSLAVGEKERVLDGEMGVDRIVEVSCLSMRKPITFCVQERFRRIRYRGFKDITVTTWNTRTNQPSELYKINAGLFLYGFFDDETGEVVEWLMVNTTAMLLALSDGRLKYSTRLNARSQQEFITLDYRQLYACNSLFAYFFNGRRWRDTNDRLAKRVQVKLNGM